MDTKTQNSCSTDCSAFHEDITRELIQIAEGDPEFKLLLEKSIAKAYKANPDPETNPVRDLPSYFAFIDRCFRAMPWEIHPEGKFHTLYDKIDQGMGCLYFVCEQPLEELAGKGYYHNSLLYHEPFRSWFIKFLSGSGLYLSTEASWNEEYYRNVLANRDFHLHDGTYESPENWHSFNDFFARRLSDPSVRPVAAPEDDSVIVSPADSVPQRVWNIDENSRVIAETEPEIAGLAVKTGTLKDVSVLLGDSKYRDCFRNGKLTHTLLDVYDYHRYHFPVSGTVKEVFIISQDDAPGGVITWDAKACRYKAYYPERFDWQSIETRGVVIVETDDGGYVAIVPVGMCQVASVNFEKNVAAGAKVRKGDPLGFFLFGGSDIVMIFSEVLDFQMTAEPGAHTLMGTAYGRIRTAAPQNK